MRPQAGGGESFLSQVLESLAFFGCAPIFANVKAEILQAGTRLFHRLMNGENRPVQVGMEPVYQRLVERDLDRLGIEDEFYAVGSAGNYSLFYVILRAVREFAPARILELGAGQTSVLLDRLVKANQLDADIVTVEHDYHWAEHIATIVNHLVVRLEIFQEASNGHIYGAYDLSSLRIDGPIDLMIIDGPPADTVPLQYARHGVLPLLKHVNRDGFVIVVDDAERPGEKALSNRIEATLKEEGIAFGRRAIVSSRRQDIFAGGRCLPAAYF